MRFSGGFYNAMDSCYQRGKLYYTIYKYIDACKYFKGELSNPYPPQSNEAGFWYGEMMFTTQLVNWNGAEKWEEDAKLYTKECPNFDAWNIDYQRAMWYYMVILYGKWCPMDDLSWLLKY